MIRIKQIKRIPVAVKDLDAAVENYKRLFGIVPFTYHLRHSEGRKISLVCARTWRR